MLKRAAEARARWRHGQTVGLTVEEIRTTSPHLGDQLSEAGDHRMAAEAKGNEALALHYRRVRAEILGWLTIDG